MKRKANYLTAAAILAAATMLSPSTAHAEEEFDPLYYAQTYPDVVDVLGLDADALYAHYINNGQYEGRFPNANAANNIVADAEDEVVAVTSSEVFVPSENTLDVLAHLEGGVSVDFADTGSAELRQMLQDVPMDAQVRETVVRIGEGVQWNESSKYQPNTAGYSTACQAYTNMLTDIATGNRNNKYGYDSIPHREITPATIQQYDTLVLAGGAQRITRYICIIC